MATLYLLGFKRGVKTMLNVKLMGGQLRRAREKRGLTLADVAKGTGYSISLVGSVERGDRAPSLLTLSDIADFYNIPVSDLFKDDVREYHIAVAKRIKDILDERNMSIPKLADMTAIGFFRLADFFNEKTAINLEELQSICKALNIPTRHFLPEIARYMAYIEYYLEGLGIDELSIKNIIEYIYSKFES